MLDVTPEKKQFVRLSSISVRPFIFLTLAFFGPLLGRGVEAVTVGCCSIEPPPHLRSYLLGDSQDGVMAEPPGPGLLLLGGGADSPKALSEYALTQIPGGDALVLCITGDDSYNSWFFDELTSGVVSLNSTETIQLLGKNQPNLEYVACAINQAEFIFIAGGDQSIYVQDWQHSAIPELLLEAWNRGAILGGTSAGASLVCGWIYNRKGHPSVESRDLLESFDHPALNLTPPFIKHNVFSNVVVDTHYTERDRKLRLAAQVDLLSSVSGSNVVYGIGLDESSALYIDLHGKFKSVGEGNAYLHRFSNPEETWQNKKPELDSQQVHLILPNKEYRLETDRNFTKAKFH